MKQTFKRIEFIILDEKGIERNYTYSYERAKKFAESVQRQCGISKIRWVDKDVGIVREETFFSSEEKR